MEPLISVVIVSYNEKEYIDEAILSVLNQSYKNIEIIIGDDGSSDGSVEIIEKYANEYPDKIRFFVNDRPENEEEVIASLRASNVLKKALSLTKGEYICCLAADDCFCDNNRFERAVGFLSKNSEYVAHGCGYKMVWPGREEILKPAKHSKFIFWCTSYLHISCFVFKRELLDAELLPERYCDDVGFMYALLCFGKWKLDDSIAFEYRQRENSIMHLSGEMVSNIMGVLLLQDMLNCDRFKTASKIRCSRAVNRVIKNRTELKKDIYKKYLNNGRSYPNDILGRICNIDDESLKNRAGFVVYWKAMLALYAVFMIPHLRYISLSKIKRKLGMKGR